MKEEVERNYLERVWGKERYMGYDRMKRWPRFLRSDRARRTGERRGIRHGFLVKGAELHPRLPDVPVFVTNAHVLNPRAEHGGLGPDDARVRFEVEARQGPSLRAPPRGQDPLDVAPGAARRTRRSRVPVRCDDLHPGEPASGALHAVAREEAPRVSSTSRAFVVGHPDGDGLQFSMFDNDSSTSTTRRRSRTTRTPTVGGSSGSPVFDVEWNVFAVHHAGDNEVPRLHGGRDLCGQTKA